MTMQNHYDNTNGSIYKFADDHGCNSYEFDIIKRVVRCRKKGTFLEDLQKTKDLIDLYIKEQTAGEKEQPTSDESNYTYKVRKSNDNKFFIYEVHHKKHGLIYEGVTKTEKEAHTQAEFYIDPINR